MSKRNAAPPPAPNRAPPRRSASGRRSRACHAARTGRSAAIAHGSPTWLPTHAYVAERLHGIDQASEHLRALFPHCRRKRTRTLLQDLQNEAASFLTESMPAELPFLASSIGAPQRLRVAVAMREWLMASRHPLRKEHLLKFLWAYQQVSPLFLVEIRLIPFALRLAVTEKCPLLPSPVNPVHLEILPRLFRNLARTCRFISKTDWQRAGEQASEVHFLLKRDPSRLYRKLDLAGRDSYRQSVERLSRMAQTSETEIARRALTLARQSESHVGEFLLGPDQRLLLQELADEHAMESACAK